MRVYALRLRKAVKIVTERDEALKELGRMITERRESLGMTLETVFDRTKIRPEYLRGIEEGNYKNFPEPVYIKGFVRTYLKLINAEDLQEDFMSQLNRMFNSGQRKNSDQRHPKKEREIKNILGNGSSLPEGFKPASHFWVFFVLLLALIGTGVYVWYGMNFNGAGLDLKNIKFFNFSRNNGALTPDEILSQDIIPVSGDAGFGIPVSVDDEPVSQEPEQKVSPFLEIHAVNDVWLSVSFGGAKPVYNRTMRRGDSMRWDLNSPATVRIGRPTAAQVILNGKDLGIVNPSGRRSETYIYNPDGTYNLVQRRSRN